MSELLFKNWQVELIRVTSFYGQVPAEQKQAWNSWWDNLVGVPSENTTVRKRDEVSQEEGPFIGGNLILALQPRRIDWYLKGQDDGQEGEQVTSQGFKCLKSEAITKFHELAIRWMKLDTCPPLTRIAFGCVLLQPVENREVGYQRLRKYLPSVDLQPGSSDFFYQINRPRESRSEVPNLRINRLSKWSVVMSRPIAVSFSLRSGDKGTLTSMTEGHAMSACRVELDINTSPEFKGELRGNDLLSVFDELVRLSREIAENGDVQ